MSRNLCSDKCDCGYCFSLADFRDQPIEFRKYGPYAPVMGTKLICPECGKVYFGWIRKGDTFWSEPREALSVDSPILRHINRHRSPEEKYETINEHIGCYVHKTPLADKPLETGWYEIDLSYYEAYNDEGEGIDHPNPAHLFKDMDDLRCRRFLAK